MAGSSSDSIVQETRMTMGTFNYLAKIRDLGRPYANRALQFCSCLSTPLPNPTVEGTRRDKAASRPSLPR